MEDKKTDKQTVFVRGVSFDIGDKEFNDFFSDIGPVRQAFLVKSRGATKHKGFGFVHFALQSDAERAAAEFNGKELGGRKVQVEVALKRAPLEERKNKRKQQTDEQSGREEAEGTDAAAAETDTGAQRLDTPPTKKPKPAKPAPVTPPTGAAGQTRQRQGGSEEKHRLLRAVAVGRLTSETIKAAIDLAHAAGEVEEVITPVPQSLVGQYKLERDGCSGAAFVAVYKSVKGAMAAVAKLHGQPVQAPGAAQNAQAGKQQQRKKGKQGGAQQQGDREEQGNTATGAVLWARQVSGEGMHLKRWRLIVRNLPFNVTEADLRAAFSPAGFLWELTLPRSSEGKGRGFVFVGYTCRAHAEKGIRLVNGQQVAGRPVAVDWALSKAQFDAAAKQQGAGATPKAGNEEEGVLQSDSDLEAPGAGKAARSRHQLGHESEDEGIEVAPEQERNLLHSVIDGILLGGDAKAAPAPEKHIGDEERGSDSEADEQEGEGDALAAAAGGDGDMFSKKALKERRVAQHAALERLDRKLQTKPLGKAIAEKEKEGGEERAKFQERQQRQLAEGATVFIRGLPLDVTKQQLQTKLQAFGKVVSCRLVVDKTSGRLKGTAFADFAEAKAAQKAAEACAKGRSKEGPGVVVAGRAVDVDLALGQEAVRSLAVQKAGERGPKDKRNLYLAKEGAIAEGTAAWEDMSQQDRNKRKRAAVEKKTKLASPNFLVSATRLSVRNIPHAWTEKQLKEIFTQAVIDRASKAQPHVKQVKILLEENAAGAPRSKGIGFVEFEDHEHALCALRQLNNNPKAWGKERRPIVEFAIENAKILKAREAKLARFKQQQAEQQNPSGQQKQQQEEEGPPAKRAKGERGNKQQIEQPEGSPAAAEGMAVGQELDAEPQPQQSKRQRRREIKLKLRALKQQKAQEAAAAAAQGKDTANGAATLASPEGSAAHSKAKKRRDLRRAKKQGMPSTAAAGATGMIAVKLSTTNNKRQKPTQQQRQQQQEGKPHGTQAQQQQRQQQEGKGKRFGRQQPQPRPGVPNSSAGKAVERDHQRQPRAGVANSKAGKVVQQAQREQQAKQLKRRSDVQLDKLVEGMTGGPKQQKARRKSSEPADRLDKLAAEYRAKFFDGGKKAGGAAGNAGAQRPAGQQGLKRWFE